jgi:hypothetical protein
MSEAHPTQIRNSKSEALNKFKARIFQCSKHFDLEINFMLC